MNVDVSTATVIGSAECIACMECVTACPTAAITYVDAEWTGLDKMRQWAGKTNTQSRASA